MQTFQEKQIEIGDGKPAWIVARVSLSNPQCLRRMLVRATEYLGSAWNQMQRLNPPINRGEILLAVDSCGGIDATPSGTNDGIRDGAATRVNFIREFIWAEDENDLRAELDRLGGEYNPN